MILGTHSVLQALGLLDGTLKLRISAMFVIVYFQTIFRTQCGYVFMLNLRTKFHAPSFIDPLVTVVTKSKE